jgi:hypothetical protein
MSELEAKLAGAAQLTPLFVSDAARARYVAFVSLRPVDHGPFLAVSSPFPSLIRH